MLANIGNDEQYNYLYDSNGNVLRIENTNAIYDFSYTSSGKIKSKYLNNNILESKEYDNNKIVSDSFGNGDNIDYIYTNGNISAVYENDDLKYEVLYNDNNIIKRYYDFDSGREYNYIYNNQQELSKVCVDNLYSINYLDDGTTSVKYKFLDYEKSANLINESLFSDNYNPNVKYDIADRPSKVILNFDNFNINITYKYKIFEPQEEDLTDDNYEEYIYDITTDNSISEIDNGYYKMKYFYNDRGLIDEYIVNNHKFKYYYDDKNQLISYVVDGDKTNLEYDYAGNIIKYGDNEYEYINSQQNNLLISANNIKNEYDEIGNPLKYKNNDLCLFGRTLKKYGDVNYNYDKNGNRIQKKCNGNSTDYYYDNGKIIYEKDKNNIISYIYYNNSIVGISINGIDYFYLKNAENDVMSIVDTNGNIVVSYLYDPFGNILNIDGILKDSVGKINPIRFKSYYYDSETNLYYLNTRYYDPSCGRFISPDDTIFLIGTYLLNNVSKNLYVYCLNDPVNRIDENGTTSRLVINTVKFLFADLDLINDNKLGATMLVLNGGNIYNAFHETAQILSADRLQENGLMCSLEVPCNRYNGRGEIDLLAGGKYVYEVKNYYDSLNKARSQVREYAECNGYLVGNIPFNAKKVEFLGNKIFMNVQYRGDGVITYSFSK